jgi:hypothetical protein
MKKFLAKLALFSIISVMLTTVNISVSSAEDTTTTKTPDKYEAEIDQVQKLMDTLDKTSIKDACIDLGDGDKKGLDEGYVITIIEEPLTFKTEGKPGDSYQSRTCVRNYISFTSDDGEEKSISELLKDCSEDIKTNKFADFPEELNIKATCQPVQVLLSKGGTSLIEGYIGTLYKWAAGIVGIIAVLVIILSGIQISAAGGETTAVENAKKRIMKSIAGIIILFLSGLILYTINPTFFVK